MKAYCLNNISKVALATLTAPDKIVEDIKDADSILVRSADMHEMDLDANILAVARAGAGVNNIPLDKYAEKGVVVFNTPGANANAVKELVLAGMLLASRDIIGGNQWIKANVDNANVGKDAEKAKKAYAGNEIYGKKIAVLGLGAIGILVANACVDLGLKVVGYDPFLSIDNALKLNKKVTYEKNLNDAVRDVDFITIHVPALDSTKGMINKDVLYAASKGVVVLDFARDTLVNEKDLEEALANGQVKKFVTDFANAHLVLCGGGWLQSNICAITVLRSITEPFVGTTRITDECDACASSLTYGLDSVRRYLWHRLDSDGHFLRLFAVDTIGLSDIYGYVEGRVFLFDVRRECHTIANLLSLHGVCVPLDALVCIG